MLFDNGSKYDYHLIIKELPEEFQGEFTCLGENSEKYINFSVPVEKDVKKIDKNGEKITETKSSKLKFIDRARSMAIPLSNLANNLAQRIHKIEYKHGNVNEKYEPCGIKYKYCNCCFERTNFKEDLIEYKCFCFNKNYKKKTTLYRLIRLFYWRRVSRTILYALSSHFIFL